MSTRTNDLRQFAGKNFVIKKIYNDYRTGCIDLGEGKSPRWQFRTFRYFGKADDEVLVGGTPRIKDFTKAYENEVGRELREQKWEDGVVKYYKVKDKIDKDFYKTWGKVFDIEIVLEDTMEVLKYKDKKNNVDVVEDTNEVLIQGVSAGKIKSMIRSLVDEEIPMVQGKDKAGNEAMVEEYDFENSMKDLLEGKFVKMKVSGSGMDTKYIFNEGKEFKYINEDDKIFNNGIDISDIPFN